MTNEIDETTEISFFPAGRDAITLALMPSKLLQGKMGRKRIEAGMRGVEKHVVETLDGFNYDPSHRAHLDINLVMLASSNNNVPMLKYWVGELGADPNVRTSALWTALISALARGHTEAKDYLLSVEGIQLGLPEAAALGRHDLVPDLIDKYDALPPEEKPCGLKGNEVAFIFSGLSGDYEWVSTLLEDVEDANVGTECPTGNILAYAIRSGNKDLVRKLLEEHGVKTRALYCHSPVTYDAVSNPDMLRFLVEELKVEVLEEIDGTSWNTLLDSAILNRDEETSRYLLSKKDIKYWSSMSEGDLLCHSAFLWNSTDLSKELLDSVNKGNVQRILRQTLQRGNLEIARSLVEQKEGDLGETRKDAVTMLEEAIYSGSPALVSYVLERDMEAAKYKHENGFNALVSSARHGGIEGFKLLVQKLPEFLNLKVWAGMSLLMVACSELSGDVIDFFLEEEFYEANCRGKTMDANTSCDNGRTALWYTVRSGNVTNVEKFLSKRQWLGLKELDEKNKVNDLFVRASMSEHYDELLDCFSQYNIVMNDYKGESLRMKAAENGSLFIAAPDQLKRLRELDISAGVDVSDEVVICAIIKNAPDWAVEKGRLADLIATYMSDIGMTKSSAGLEQAIMRCDWKTAEFLEEEDFWSTKSPMQLVLMALQNRDMTKNKSKVPHPSFITQQGVFIRWLLRRKGTKQEAIPCDKKLAYDVLKAVLASDLDIDIVRNTEAEPTVCTEQQLFELLQTASKYCQFANVKTLSKALGENTKLSDLKNKSGENLIQIALDNKKLSEKGRRARLPLIHWLATEGHVDLTHVSNDGGTVLMSAAGSGNAQIFNWILERVGGSLLKLEDNQGRSVVDKAISGGNIQILQQAIKANGAGVCGHNGEMPLHLAAAKGDLTMVRYLVEVVKADVNARDSTGRTALDLCIFGNNVSAQDYLEVAMGKKKTDDEENASPRHTVHKWLISIGKAAGVSLGLNSQGICAFTYEDHTIVVEVPETVGSLFMYAQMDAQKFAIEEDTLKMLLEKIIPGANPMVCPSLEPKRGGANGVDVTVSLTERIEDIDEKGFKDLLERFIDAVITTATQLKICASKRLISRILSRISTDGVVGTTNNTNKFDSVLDSIGMYAVEPPKKPHLEAQDIETFRKSLTSHMVEINKAVQKNMTVNHRGMVVFTYNHLTISIEPTSANKMLLSTTVAENPKPWSFKHALQLNYLQQETRGGTIACGGNGELYFMYEDTIDVNPSDFRNILENFIDTSLDLSSRLQRHSGPIHLTEESLERDMKNKAKTIRDFRNGDQTLLERIFAQSDSKVIQGNIDALIFTVVDTNDMEVLRFLVSTTLRLVKNEEENNAIRETFFKRVCEKDMFDDDLLSQIVDGANPKFELNTINSVFISLKLLSRKKIASTAQKMIDLYRARSLERGDEVSEHIMLNDWNKYVLSLFSISKTSTDVEETIAGLDWILSHTEPEKIADGKAMESALHYAASHGHVKLAEYILNRFPELSLDEDTLHWACKLNHIKLVEFIINRSKDLPRSRAIEAAGASGSVEILKALGVGCADDEDDQEELLDGNIPKGIASAAEAAISNSKWDALECIVTDKRLKAPLNGFLLKASSSSYPQKAIGIILRSRFAAGQMYDCRIPWQAQALVLDKQVAGLLHVLTTCNLPMEIGAMVWSFSKPVCEDAPLITSSYNFMEKYRVQLERDLNICDVTRKDNDTFILPGIGDLSFRDGYCRVKKRFDADGVSMLPSDPLRMSFELNGCFLGTRKLHSGLWLQRVVSLDNSFKYTELRLMLRSFANVSRIVKNVLSDAKKFNVAVPASNLSSIAQEARVFTQIRAENVIKRYGKNFTLSHFSQSKLVRVTTPCSTPDSVGAQALLEDNMTTSNEAFFCTDKDNNMCAAVYLFPEKVDDSRLLAILADKASIKA